MVRFCAARNRSKEQQTVKSSLVTDRHAVCHILHTLALPNLLTMQIARFYSSIWFGRDFSGEQDFGEREQASAQVFKARVNRLEA